MPVLAKQAVPVDQHLYDYHFHQRAAELALYHSAISASSIHQRLQTFRSHHQKCASRRRYALANEMKQESQRADWLKRKYIDPVRQQQPSQQPTVMASSSGRVSGVSATVTTSVAGEGNSESPDHHHLHYQSDVKPLSKGGNSNPAASSLPTHPPTQSSESVGDSVVGGREYPPPPRGAGMVRVKCEPESEDSLPTTSTPTLCSESHEATRSEPHPLHLPEKTRESEPKRRESIKAEHFKWDQDNRDDLKLTAYDVIAGVISTPPIKPLEPESDTTSSKVAPLTSQSSPNMTVSSQQLTNGASHNPASRVSKEHQELVHELDQFSKIMDEIERAAGNTSGGSFSVQKTDHKQLYGTTDPSQSSIAKESSGSFYRPNLAHNYSSSSSPAAEHEGNLQPLQHHGLPVDTKSSSVQRRHIPPRRLTLLNEVPLSPSPQQPAVPITPTTPLEHFLSAPSPTRMMTVSVSYSATTPSSQTPHLAMPQYQMTHSTSPHHLPAIPDTPHHHTALPGTPHHHTALPGTPHHHTALPGTPHHHNALPGTPHHHTALPGTPHHHTALSSNRHHHSALPGTPHHQTALPNIPHMAPSSTSHHHSVGLGTSRHTAQIPGSISHHTSNPHYSTPLPCPTTPYICPPYPATPQYRFECEPARYTTVPTETWTTSQLPALLSKPLPPDHTPVSSQGTLRESIMARVNSRVEALAGHKRPLHLDLTGAPPTKMKNNGGELRTGQQPAVHSGPPIYSSRTQQQPSPYHTPSHQSL